MTLRILSCFFLYWFIFIPMSMACWVGIQENQFISYISLSIFFVVLHSFILAMFYLVSIVLFFLIEALPITKKCIFTHLFGPFVFLIAFGFALNIEGFIMLLYVACTYLLLIFILRQKSDLSENR